MWSVLAPTQLRPRFSAHNGSGLDFQSVMPTTISVGTEENSVATPPGQLPCSEDLSIEGLRDELQSFAATTLKGYLEELAVRVRREIGEDIRHSYVTRNHDRLPSTSEVSCSFGHTSSTSSQGVEKTRSGGNRHEWAKRPRRNAIITKEVKKLKELEDCSSEEESLENSQPHKFVERRQPSGSLGLRMPSEAHEIIVGTLSDHPCSLRRKAQAVVRNSLFEKVVFVMISCNVLYIALVTNHMAINELSELPVLCYVIEVIFLIVFFIEITIRLLAQPTIVFVRSTMRIEFWNLFDSLVVFTQILEMSFGWADSGMTLFGQISVLRLLRLSRIIRVARVVRVFRFVRHLRMIVFSVFRSLSLLLWSVFALSLVTLMWSVYFTEVALSHKLASGEDGHGNAPLDVYFGSLSLSMLSLLQAITGGFDWNDVCISLRELGTVFGLAPFLAYVFFTTIALLNVISGVFLEAAMERAREEREIYLVESARVVFAAADTDRSGLITWPNFRKAMENTDVCNFFDAIDLDISEAKNLFDLLDISADGKVSAEEFLSGCLRVRGPAKSLDLMVLSNEVAQLFEKHDFTEAKVDSNQHVIRASLASLHQPRFLEERKTLSVKP
eukprot:TRINITY_DN5351_c0_g1_i3.p1 TRINITY_DN5351_c0_g1~~TRINITY_DN5351_c0_g1_i3.p1  ORF type:complete len:613 (+),score=108.13 TRINITY_DN5351_c0_g1_i3:15-1853(+)